MPFPLFFSEATEKCHFLACTGFMHCRHHCFISVYVFVATILLQTFLLCNVVLGKWIYIHNYIYIYLYQSYVSRIPFWPVAPCSNNRVVFSSMLHVFLGNVNKRQYFWFTGDFILSPRSAASSWQRPLHHQEICTVLQGWAYCFV